MGFIEPGECDEFSYVPIIIYCHGIVVLLNEQFIRIKMLN